ncbi:DUF6463 family protein [Lysobacter korlensis]|uniref:DUF6463 family protein n=1 Tax=Lysobacter korlensis TaxID=553636 RepID=A0ABV6RZA0_9GAMM
MAEPTSRVSPLRSAGVWSVALGLVHIAAVGAVYPGSVRSIREAGVIGSLDAEPALAERRGVGFWYVTTGLFLIGQGAMVREHENAHGRPPATATPLLLLIGAWGAALTPVSGFWLFLPIALLARRGRRSHRPSENAPGRERNAVAGG